MTDLRGLRWVRLVFVDVFGGIHAVVLPANRFELAVEKGAPFDGSALEGRARHFEADMLLRPDPSTLIELGDGQARVTCTVTGADGLGWPGDPRTSLARLLADNDELPTSYRAAAELEFYILEPDGLPVDRGGYFSELEGEGTAVTRAAAERLDGFGIEVISTHLESGPGQYEIDLGSMAPQALADALVLTKQVLREEAATAGLRVTFMARPFVNQPGSGLHLHQHLEAGPAGPLFDSRGALAPAGKAFVAGQLAHAAGLTALAAPNVNSYKRLHSGPEAPADIVWGHLNRAALVRVGSDGEQRPAIEFRLADPAANPYLLIAGLLAAARHGLDAGLDPGAPFEEDIGGFDSATSTTMQVRALPRDLDQALDELMADDVLVDAFDSRLLSRLVDGRRAEAEAYRAQVTPWEVERYLDEA
ncbi:MAG: glutamine synthetase family protein [Actinomycetota bacterium]|nr:glutamine synthetase family protein [Actinomycetota bacterium]